MDKTVGSWELGVDVCSTEACPLQVDEDVQQLRNRLDEPRRSLVSPLQRDHVDRFFVDVHAADGLLFAPSSVASNDVANPSATLWAIVARCVMSLINCS